MIDYEGDMIVFEGADMSGKTTQMRELAKRLDIIGARYKTMKFPNTKVESGRLIYDIIEGRSNYPKEKMPELFAKNRYETRDEMLDYINDGYLLLLDRYAHSNVATQAAVLSDKMDSSPEDDEHIMKQVAVQEYDIIFPNKVVFLSMDPRKALERGRENKDSYEKMGIQIKIWKNYMKMYKMAQEGRDIFWDKTKWIKIDASNTVERVAKNIWNVLEPTIMKYW